MEGLVGPLVLLLPLMEIPVISWMIGFLGELLAIVGPVSILITMTTTGILGVLVAYKNPGKSINRVFAAWMIVSAVNSLFLLLFLVIGWRPFQLLVYLIGMMDPCFALHFALLFTRLRPKGKWAKLVYLLPYIPYMVSLVMFFLALMIEGLHLFYMLQLQVILSHLAIMYLLVFFSLAFVGMAAFVKRKGVDEETAAKERNQARYVFLGIFIMIVSFVLGNVFGIAIISFLLVPASALVFAFAILKHQLMGIEVIIKKGLTYTGISLLIVIIFIALEESMETVITKYLPEGNELFMAIATAIIVSVVVFPAQRLLASTLDRLMPQTEDEDARRMRLGSYSTALSTAIADKSISDKELQMLQNLKKDLNISKDEEEEIAGELGLDKETLRAIYKRVV